MSKRASPPRRPGRRLFGLGTDIGMPDGLNLSLLLAPTSWMRLAASAGTNSAGLGYRGGLTFVPVGWGTSFTFEVGHCDIGSMNSWLSTFFSVAKWAKPYIQELGYTYFNAHLGFDYPVRNFIFFVHGGYTYLSATVRGPNPVVVVRNSDQTPNTTVTLVQDGDVQAHTLSAKLGILYMFGGGS